MHHRRHHHYQEDGFGLLGSFTSYALLGLLLLVVGGATWLALTPLTAPTAEVTHLISNDRFAP